jgi:hypothetical protein
VLWFLRKGTISTKADNSDLLNGKYVSLLVLLFAGMDLLYRALFLYRYGTWFVSVR